jgi:hypothetical protein
MSFYIILKSKACLDIHPNNQANNFINDFDDPILLNGNWSVAMIEYTFSERLITDNTLTITTNIVKPTVVGGIPINLLREIWCGDDENGILHESVDPLMYMPVLNNTINKIEINILDDTNQFIDFKKELQVSISLHFLKTDE